MDDFLKNELLELKANSSYRQLKQASGLDFSSNDYLGLSTHPKIREAIEKALRDGVPVGSGGSRLLRGNHPMHIELEEFAAEFFNVESTLFFSSGFLANYALFTTLPQRGDVVLYDELIHASVRDGLRSTTATKFKFKHNDMASLESVLIRAAEKNPRNIWIAAESVYSMDGDISDIAGMVELIAHYDNAQIIYDEAHSTGIFGRNGRGVAEELDHTKIISLHTCGKALGVSGAFVCGPKTVIDYLINKARPFIYTTAESPLIAVAVKQALELVDEEPWRRERLFELINTTNRLFADIFNANTSFKSQIIPVILNENALTIDAASHLQGLGYDIRAIRPPTVPTARLRVSLNINRTENELERLFCEIKTYLDKVGEDIHF